MDTVDIKALNERIQQESSFGHDQHGDEQSHRWSETFG